jgi:RNA polymerase sigma-70 factor (ECF subfamily)
MTSTMTSKRLVEITTASTPTGRAPLGRDGLVEPLSMNAFLRTVERRAFHMAKMATGNPDTALDIVQDSMYKLVEKYSHKTSLEWRPLFYRILNGKIIDQYRRKAVRDRLFPWRKTVDEMIMRAQRIKQLTKGVSALSSRQREAFMLRCWEGISTSEAAAVMGCSEGSVKTHYSRAMHTLQDVLEDYRYD